MGRDEFRASEYGIVFSGGGALGAWEVGCYRAIRSFHGDRPPIVATGASAGALNAVAVACGMSAQQLGDIWCSISNGDVYSSNIGVGLLGRIVWESARRRSLMAGAVSSINTLRSVYDTAPLNRTLERILSGYFQAFRQSETRCAITVTNLALKQKEVYFKLRSGESFARHLQLEQPVGWMSFDSQEILIKTLVGSTAIPIMFPPTGHYFDGGVLLNQPITPAVSLGALNLYVVIPSPADLGDTSCLTEIGSTLLTTWLSASMIAQVENIRLRNKIRKLTGQSEIRLIIVRPEIHLTRVFGVSLLSFGRRVPELLSHGERAAAERLNRFDPQNDATWYE